MNIENLEGLPSFGSREEVKSYVSRFSLECSFRNILGGSVEFDFIERDEPAFSGILLVKLRDKEGKSIPFVGGVIDRLGNPWISLVGLPTGHEQTVLARKIRKINGL